MYAYRANTTVTRRWHTAYTTLRRLHTDAIDAFNTRNVRALEGAQLHDRCGTGLVIEHQEQPAGCRPYPWSQDHAAAPMWIPDQRTRLGRVYADQLAGLPRPLDGIRIHQILGPMGGMPGLGRSETAGTIYRLDQVVLDGYRYDLWDRPVPGLDPAVWEPISLEEFEAARAEQAHRERRHTVGGHIEVLARRPVAAQSQDLHRDLVAAAWSAHANVRNPEELRELEGAMARACELLDEQYYPGLIDAQVRPWVRVEIETLVRLGADRAVAA